MLYGVEVAGCSCEQLRHDYHGHDQHWSIYLVEIAHSFGFQDSGRLSSCVSKISTFYLLTGSGGCVTSTPHSIPTSSYFASHAPSDLSAPAYLLFDPLHGPAATSAQSPYAPACCQLNGVDRTL